MPTSPVPYRVSDVKVSKTILDNLLALLILNEDVVVKDIARFPSRSNIFSKGINIKVNGV